MPSIVLCRNPIPGTGEGSSSGRDLEDRPRANVLVLSNGRQTTSRYVVQVCLHHCSKSLEFLGVQW